MRVSYLAVVQMKLHLGRCPMCGSANFSSFETEVGEVVIVSFHKFTAGDYRLINENASLNEIKSVEVPNGHAHYIETQPKIKNADMTQ